MDVVLVDARRLLCPLPVIRLQQAVRKAPKGSLIRVLATDPGVQSDIPAWCRVHQLQVVRLEQVEREWVVEIRT